VERWWNAADRREPNYSLQKPVASHRIHANRPVLHREYEILPLGYKLVSPEISGQL